MKKFLRHIKESFGSSTFYAHAKNQSTGKGFIFLLKTCTFVGVIIGIVVIVYLAFTVPKMKTEVVQFIDTAYPADLVVTIKDDTLSANITEPLFVGIPSSDEEMSEEFPANIVVLAPEQPADATLLETYDTFMVLTSKAIIAGTPDDIRVVPYKDMDGVITKTMFMQVSRDVVNLIGVISYFAVIPLAILVLLVVAFLHLVWLLVVSIVTFLLFKLRKLPLTYKQAYRLGVHALVPLMILEVIMVSLPWEISGKLFTALVVLAIISLASRDWKKPIDSIAETTV